MPLQFKGFFLVSSLDIKHDGLLGMLMLSHDRQA